MTTEQQQFLELLRAGLWGKPADPTLFPIGSTDWKTITRIGMEQAVPVIIMDGMETLPQEHWPSKEIMLRLMMLRVKTSQMHLFLNNTLNQIVEALNAEGIPSALLKGQGVAQNYLKPESRSCGDIDLYTGQDNYTRACEIIESLDDETSHAIECDHHMHMQLNGIEVELHRQADYMPGKRSNGKMQEWTKESIDANFGTDALRSWNNNGTDIKLPSPTFDAFFILHHAVRHMTVEGIGFRQICDWIMYLDRHHDKVDTELLEKKLKEFNLTQVWKEFGLLAINILGLNAEHLPLHQCRMKSRKTYELTRHIFISGNFGKFDTNIKNRSKTTYLKRKWRSFRYQSSRLFKLLGLFPKFIITFCIGWLVESTLRLIRFR